MLHPSFQAVQHARLLVLICRTIIRSVCFLCDCLFAWFSNYSNTLISTPFKSPSPQHGITSLYNATQGIKAQTQWDLSGIYTPKALCLKGICSLVKLFGSHSFNTQYHLNHTPGCLKTLVRSI